MNYCEDEGDDHRCQCGRYLRDYHPEDAAEHNPEAIWPWSKTT